MERILYECEECSERFSFHFMLFCKSIEWFLYVGNIECCPGGYIVDFNLDLPLDIRSFV